MGNCLSSSHSCRRTSRCFCDKDKEKSDFEQSSKKDRRRDVISPIFSTPSSKQGESLDISGLTNDDLDRRIHMVLKEIGKSDSIIGALVGDSEVSECKQIPRSSTKSKESQCFMESNDSNSPIRAWQQQGSINEIMSHSHEEICQENAATPLIRNLLLLQTIQGALFTRLTMTSLSSVTSTTPSITKMTDAKTTQSCPNLEVDLKLSSRVTSENEFQLSTIDGAVSPEIRKRSDSYNHAIITKQNSIHDDCTGISINSSEDLSGKQILQNFGGLKPRELSVLPEEEAIEIKTNSADDGVCTKRKLMSFEETKENILKDKKNILSRQFKVPPPYISPPPPNGRMVSISEENLLKDNQSNFTGNKESNNSHSLWLLRHPSLEKYHSPKCTDETGNKDLEVVKPKTLKSTNNRFNQSFDSSKTMMLQERYFVSDPMTSSSSRSLERRGSYERQRRRGVMAGGKDSPRIELLDTQGRITQAFPSPNSPKVVRGHRSVTRMDAGVGYSNSYYQSPKRVPDRLVVSATRKRKNSPSKFGENSTNLAWASYMKTNDCSSNPSLQSCSSMELKSDLNGKWCDKKVPSMTTGSSFEMCESSETESAKDSRGGSIENETQDNSTIAPCKDAITSQTPSEKTEPTSVENLSVEDVENKFNNLALAFKTDKITIKERLESHRRQRDIAEKNIESEHAVLKNSINEINHTTKDSETREKISKILHHLDIFMQSVSRLSSKAETYGSVQQEERISKIMEVVIMHASNLTREKEKAVHELFEAKVLLSDTKVQMNGRIHPELSREDSTSKEHNSTKLLNHNRSRRASLAALPRAMYDNVMVGLGHLFPMQHRNDHASSLVNLRSRCQSAHSHKSKHPSLSSNGSLTNRRISLPVGPMPPNYINPEISPNFNHSNHYRRRTPKLHKLSKIDSVDSFESYEENNNSKSVHNANVVQTEEDLLIRQASQSSLTESMSSSPPVISDIHEEDVFPVPKITELCDEFLEKDYIQDEIIENELAYEYQPCQEVHTPDYSPCLETIVNIFNEIPNYIAEIEWKQVANFFRFVVVGILVVAAIFVLIAPFSQPLFQLYSFFQTSK